MDTFELLELLEQGRHDLGCKEVSLRCDCENLETVYVVERSGELTVTDQGDTFQYLDRSNANTYTSINIDQAQLICRRHAVRLENLDGEHYPEVMQIVGDKPVRVIIDAVSAAVDGLFETAMRRKPNTPRG